MLYMYIKYLKVISIGDFPVFFTSPLQDVMSNGILTHSLLEILPKNGF